MQGRHWFSRPLPAIQRPTPLFGGKSDPKRRITAKPAVFRPRNHWQYRYRCVTSPVRCRERQAIFGTGALEQAASKRTPEL